MYKSTEIEAGYERNGSKFYATETPWYGNKPFTFEEAVKAVKGGVDEFGDKVEFEDPRTEVVRVREIARNWSHGEVENEETISIR